MTDDQSREHFHGLARDYAGRYAQLVVDALGGQVSHDAAAILHRVGFELGHGACQTLAQEITSRTTPVAGDGRRTVEITREQVECWAERALTDDEVSRLDDCIPNSSIPDAVADIVAGLAEGSDG
ncbi:hypothetical protein [Actinoplanes sp. NPDC049118]|uniref:hypothetical protein n=1 Tax=Actinoplanes sp. NPDC049118 TaxID=3155769 RepID=UPI0033D0D0D7